MAIQRLFCRPGNHSWQRQSQRGKPPHACPDHKEDASRLARVTVVRIDPPNNESAQPEISGAFISGEALCDRLMSMLAARGTLISQNRDRSYAGPRY